MLYLLSKKRGSFLAHLAYTFVQFSEEPKWLRYFMQSQQADDPAISNKISARISQIYRHENAFFHSIDTA